MEAKKVQELLHILEDNGQLDVESIATMIDAPVDEVKETISRLEKEHIILKYPAVINWDRVEGNGDVEAMIDVKVTPQRDVGFDEIAARIYKFPEVQSVYLMSGAYDLSVTVVGKSINDVGRFVSQKLSTMDHVLSTTTHFILKTYKHDGIIYDDPHEDKRMIVTP